MLSFPNRINSHVSYSHCFCVVFNNGRDVDVSILWKYWYLYQGLTLHMISQFVCVMNCYNTNDTAHTLLLKPLLKPRGMLCITRMSTTHKIAVYTQHEIYTLRVCDKTCDTMNMPLTTYTVMHCLKLYHTAIFEKRERGMGLYLKNSQLKIPILIFVDAVLFSFRCFVAPSDTFFTNM